MKFRSFLSTAIAAVALGFAAPVHADGISQLCEMDRNGSPKGCFYVQRSDIWRIKRDYSPDGKPRSQPLWGEQIPEPLMTGEPGGIR